MVGVMPTSDLSLPFIASARITFLACGSAWPSFECVVFCTVFTLSGRSRLFLEPKTCCAHMFRAAHMIVRINFHCERLVSIMCS